MRAKDNTQNLCDTCTQNVANCFNKEIEFGDGVGNDNVVACSMYIEKPIQIDTDINICPTCGRMLKFPANSCKYCDELYKRN